MMLKDLYINHKRAPYILKGELFTPSTIKEHYISSKETYEHQLPAPSLSLFLGGTGDPCRLHATASRACLLRSMIKLLSSSLLQLPSGMP